MREDGSSYGRHNWSGKAGSRVNERRVITASEAQTYLGIPASTVRSWARRGHIHAVSIASRARRWYLLSEVLDLAGR